MPRRGKIVRRTVIPDARYDNLNVTRMIGRVMKDGKRSIAEMIVYRAIDIIEERAKTSNNEMLKKPAIEIFEQAIRNTSPAIEVRPKRVGGATYQVPVDIRQDRRNALSMRWIINAARSRKSKPMFEKLAQELLDAAVMEGGAVRKKDEMHKMADSNKAFAHYKR